MEIRKMAARSVDNTQTVRPVCGKPRIRIVLRLRLSRSLSNLGFVERQVLPTGFLRELRLLTSTERINVNDCDSWTG